MDPAADPAADPTAHPDAAPPWGRLGRAVTLWAVAGLSQVLLRVANNCEARQGSPLFSPQQYDVTATCARCLARPTKTWVW